MLILIHSQLQERGGEGVREICISCSGSYPVNGSIFCNECKVGQEIMESAPDQDSADWFKSAVKSGQIIIMS